MKLKKVIQEFIAYYRYSRSVGHSALMLNGFKNRDGDKLCIVSNLRTGKNLGLKSGEFISISSDLTALRGIRKAICFDNSALLELFERIDSELNRLESENQRLKERLALTDKITV
jgi:hypothetical protein